MNQTVCALRFFYGVTLGHAEIPERIVYARAPRTLPVVLSADEVVRFLEAVPSLKTRTALATAYAAGLRASETVGLKVGDIDSGRGVIRIEHGKGGKDRTVMLSAQHLRILRVYWRLAKPQGWLFPGRDADRPIDVQVLYSSCRSARAAAGIDKRVTVHTLRHSFATHLLENGTDIRIIQVLLGHNNLSSTARYTKVSNGLIRLSIYTLIWDSGGFRKIVTLHLRLGAFKSQMKCNTGRLSECRFLLQGWPPRLDAVVGDTLDTILDRLDCEFVEYPEYASCDAVTEARKVS